MRFEVMKYVLLRCHPTEDSPETTVIVPEQIRIIGTRAFFENRTIEEVILPDSLQVIKESAFEGCHSLRAVRIPPDVHKLEDFVFLHCNSLTSLTLPETIRSCGNLVLDGCTHLNEITVYKQDGREFRFPVHSQYRTAALKLLLHLPYYEKRLIPSDQFCRLLYMMLDSGYDETNDTAEYLFLSAVSQCIEKNDAGALASLKTLLEDAPKMQKVHPQCFEDMIVFANERRNFDMQLLLMDAAKRYCTGSREKRFQL